VWGEEDCYQEKKMVLNKCRKTLKVGKPYVEPRPCLVPPILPQISLCKKKIPRHMTCVCEKLTVEEENEVSAGKLVRLASECNNPVSGGIKRGSKCIKISISFLH
jgi:hypothetical protein